MMVSAVPMWKPCDVITHKKMDMPMCSGVPGGVFTFITCKLDLYSPKFELWYPREPQKKKTYAVIAHMIGLLGAQQRASMFKTIFATGEMPMVSPS